jgi:hypothetical protein
MDDGHFGYKQKFLLKKNYYFISVIIIQGSKAKVEGGARESVHMQMQRKMSARPQKLSDS